MMFSDHLQVIDKAPTKKMFLILAALVVVCQLVAMAVVAEGQVEKASQREASQASFQAAMASCIESSRGTEVKDCARLTPPESVHTLSGSSPSPLVQGTQGHTLVTLTNRY